MILRDVELDTLGGEDVTADDPLLVVVDVLARATVVSERDLEQFGCPVVAVDSGSVKASVIHERTLPLTSGIAVVAALSPHSASTHTTDVISRNICTSAGDRALLAQNILSQARNLVEGMIVRLHEGVGTATFSYAKVGPASDTVKADGKVNFLPRFPKLLQISASHYTATGSSPQGIYADLARRVQAARRHSAAADCRAQHALE